MGLKRSSEAHKWIGEWNHAVGQRSLKTASKGPALNKTGKVSWKYRVRQSGHTDSQPRQQRGQGIDPLPPQQENQAHFLGKLNQRSSRLGGTGYDRVKSLHYKGMGYVEREFLQAHNEWWDPSSPWWPSKMLAVWFVPSRQELREFSGGLPDT
jgi:hypothetical protein